MPVYISAHKVRYIHLITKICEDKNTWAFRNLALLSVILTQNRNFYFGAFETVILLNRMKNTEVLHILNSFNTRGYQTEGRDNLHTHSLHMCLNHIISLWARMRSERFVKISPNLNTLWTFIYCTLSTFVTAVALPRYNLTRFHTFLLGNVREKNEVSSIISVDCT